MTRSVTAVARAVAGRLPVAHEPARAAHGPGPIGEAPAEDAGAVGGGRGYR